MLKFAKVAGVEATSVQRPTKMNRDLCDETFPSSLLIAFDDLSDEIPVSPEPVLQPLLKQIEEQGILRTASSVATTTTAISTETAATTTITSGTVTVGNLSDEGTGKTVVAADAAAAAWFWPHDANH